MDIYGRSRHSVKFMHDNSVTHMNLKPANVMVPTTYGRPTMVDFGLPVRLKNKTQPFKCYVGTKGYIVPKVGKFRFSADVCGQSRPVGKVVKGIYYMLCRPSTSRDWLLVFSNGALTAP